MSQTGQKEASVLTLTEVRKILYIFVDKCIERKLDMGIFLWIRNFLKRFMPPPTRTFLRENERVLASINDLRKDIDVLHSEQAELHRLQSIHFQINQEYHDLLQLFTAENSKHVQACDSHLERINYLLSDVVPFSQKNYEYYCSLDPSKYPYELAIWYKNVTGEELNLQNPQTFNEKIQWLKLYDSTPLKTRLADKYLVRDWVAERIGDEYLVPLLGVWDSFDEINFDNLPNQFVLKANHGSGWNIIVKDKAALNIEDAKKKFDKWMHTNFAFKNGLELHYRDIRPRILAEEYIQNTIGLIDYRFYCFNGKPFQVWVDIFSGTPNHMRSVFDMDWNYIPLQCTWPDGYEILKKCPQKFEDMKTIAKELSREFSFVRVDFFEVNGKLYVGELTFTPMSGIGKFVPQSWDAILGKMLQLPCKKSID